MSYGYTISTEELGPHWYGFAIETTTTNGSRVGGRLVGYVIGVEGVAVILLEHHEPIEIQPKTSISVAIPELYQRRQPAIPGSVRDSEAATPR